MSHHAKPKVSYWQLWTDKEGISHQIRCSMTKFELDAIGSGVDPQWKGHQTGGRMTTMVTVLPVGWIGEWHENPKPQWIVPLSGRWSVESMDGTRIELGRGEISFGGDQHCKETHGRKGHRSTTVGDEQAVLLLVQFEDIPAPTSACAFP